jgi:hypothetical protein
MVRECWVYPDKGEPYLKGSRSPQQEGRGYATVLPDLPDFVSPIDGRSYSGRAGMREHNVRHNVVPTADLAGLPTTRPVDAISPRDRAERKERIIHAVNTYWR